MAAVALLAILYTVLARVAIEGLRAEGESKRRLEASLLADERVAESFTGLAGNVVMPELGHSETTEGDFTVGLDVTLFQPPVEWGVGESVGNTPLLFASAPGVPGAQALRTVQLTVSWLEGAEERHVSRTIFLVDFGRVAALAASSRAGPGSSRGDGFTPGAPGPAVPRRRSADPAFRAGAAVRRDAGFTLIEVLAVVLLTGIVVGVALDFYLDLSRASNRAAGVTRETRRTAAVLDRMVQDLQNVVFVHKPDAVDPLVHPWIFLADSGDSELGADRVKFVTRGHDPRRSALPESDLAVVTYTLRRDQEGGLELWRSETPGLPDGLDREFPAEGSPGDALFADGVAAFGLIFRDDLLQPKTSWDSSSLASTRASCPRSSRSGSRWPSRDGSWRSRS